MKIILLASVSINGKILLAENPNHQVPQEVVGDIMQKAIQSGNLVLGRKTFDLMMQYPATKQAFSNVEIVLLSAAGHGTNPEGYNVVNSPEQAISYLKEKGFTEISIGGGTQTYNAFLEKNLVTDLCLNLIPVIAGDGGIIGTKEDLLTKFKLNGHRLITDNIFQLSLSKAS